jgi:heme exporter protein A
LIRGERCLFQGLSFALESGGLLSLIRAIAGMLSLEEGSIYWNDVPVEKQRQTFHGNLVWLAHRTGLKGDLTLVENLGFECRLRAVSKRDPEEVFERLGIARLKKLIVRSLSAGQQRRVALARMLLADVPLWFMDEPFTNLDREGRALVMELVEEHLADGGLCVMAAHQDIEVNAPLTRVKIQ